MSSKERVIISKWKKVSLVVPEKEDVELWYKWINNLEINQYLRSWEFLYSYEQEVEYYENLTNDKNSIKFAIYVNDEKKVIWNVDLILIEIFRDEFYEINKEYFEKLKNG
jgi:RimJ/RimL family protein N-acetyltransferase